MQTLGIFSVATNKYINYWAEMVRSVTEHASHQFDLTFYVFTDQSDYVSDLARELPQVQLRPFTVANLGWPDATILRFELISGVIDEVDDDILMHLDADMLMHQPFGEDFLEVVENQSMFLVGHPGFFASYLRANSEPPQLNMFEKYILRRKMINHLPQGSWETNHESCAKVPKELQKVYVCGATWGGSYEKFKDMVKTLGGQTAQDRENNVMAVWHDESHLNKWASENEFTLLPPSYCYVEKFVSQLGYPDVIEAVEKGANRTR